MAHDPAKPTPAAHLLTSLVEERQLGEAETLALPNWSRPSPIQPMFCPRAETWRSIVGTWQGRRNLDCGAESFRRQCTGTLRPIPALPLRGLYFQCA